MHVQGRGVGCPHPAHTRPLQQMLCGTWLSYISCTAIDPPPPRAPARPCSCTVGALAVAMSALCRTAAMTTLVMNIILLLWVLVGGGWRARRGKEGGGKAGWVSHGRRAETGLSRAASERVSCCCAAGLPLGEGELSLTL